MSAFPTVFLNGRFLNAEDARVSVFDRGFLYGDALFETMRVWRGEPFQWREHMDRLIRGAGALSLPVPFEVTALRQAVAELCRANAATDAILRIHLSRGPGERGYSPRNAGPATVVGSLHPAPPLGPDPAPWKLATASIRLPPAHLASCKHASKLLNILARAESDRQGADEALLLDSDGFLAEGSCANLFWVENGTLHTPPADDAVLPGITRAFAIDWCAANDVPCRETRALPGRLAVAEGVFLTLSTRGVVEAVELDGTPLARSPLAGRIYMAWLAALDAAAR